MPGGGDAGKYNYEDAYLAYAGYAGDPIDSTQDDGIYNILAAAKKKWSADPMSPLAASRELKCWLFPTAFTLFCFATFTVPVYLMSTYIGRDMHVAQFVIGVHPRVALYLPVIYLATHVVHVCLGRPNRLLVFVCLFGSSLLLLVEGDQIGRAADRNADGLKDSNCHSFQAKWELEVQWQAARTFYATCMVATSVNTGTSFEQDVAAYRIRDCVGYDDAALRNPGWSYLQEMEESHRCAGWCAESQAIWTTESVKDNCVLVAAEVLGAQISTAATQVQVYSLLVLFFLTVAACIGESVVTEWFGG